MIEPLNDKVLILPDPVKETTESGLYIPESAARREKLFRGTVVGKSRKVEDVNIDDRVLFPQSATTDHEVDGIKHLFIRETDIWAKL